MNQVERFFRRYVFSCIGILSIFLLVNVLIVGAFLIASYFEGFSHSKFSIDEFSNHIRNVDGKIEAEENIHGVLKQTDSWAMILNDEGTIIWEDRLPENLKHKYSVTDVALFSRWYLEEYPVNIWERTDGLLVVGFLPDKVVQHYSSLDKDYFKMLSLGIVGAILINLFLIILLFIRNTHRIEKAMTPILSGIHSLSKGQPICLDEDGELAEISAELNSAGHYLQKKDNTRSEWIRGVSHDVRTPLSMILGYASQMKDDTALPAETRKQADLICLQSEKLRDLIADLNLTTKLEYSVIAIKNERIVPVELARQVICEYLNSDLPSKYNLLLSEESMGDSTRLYGDEFLLKRMLKNLIQNCILHNPDGCEITVAVESKISSHTFTVVDNGIGMDKSVLELLNKNLCVPTSQAENETEHGLGLRIVKQIVQIHQGTLYFSGIQPHGLSVKITIPNTFNQGTI